MARLKHKLDPVAEFVSHWVSGVLASLAVFGAALLLALFYIPDTPLPDRFNPVKDLDPQDQISFLTQYKLRKSLKIPGQCQAVLGELSANLVPEEDYIVSDQCGISNRVTVTDLAGARIAQLDTRCETALRLGMWAEHSVQPAAQKHLGQPVAELLQIGSYNCRPIRSVNGPTGRMSEHARANAVDITGFVLADGTRITLLKHWDDPTYGPFLKEVRDGGCAWFNVTLGPDYNRLHADHFHFDQGIWRSCR